MAIEKDRLSRPGVSLFGQRSTSPQLSGHSHVLSPELNWPCKRCRKTPGDNDTAGLLATQNCGGQIAHRITTAGTRALSSSSPFAGSSKLCAILCDSSDSHSKSLHVDVQSLKDLWAVGLHWQSTMKPSTNSFYQGINPKTPS